MCPESTRPQAVWRPMPERNPELWAEVDELDVALHDGPTFVPYPAADYLLELPIR